MFGLIFFGGITIIGIIIHNYEDKIEKLENLRNAQDQLITELNKVLISKDALIDSMKRNSKILEEYEEQRREKARNIA